MSFVDHSAATMFTVQAYKTICSEFAGNLRSFAASALAGGEQGADKVFCPHRLKSARLPAVESCQSSIFRELRVREESHTAEIIAQRAARPSLFGLKSRIGQIFAGQSQMIH